jgi:hypothetical protein
MKRTKKSLAIERMWQRNPPPPPSNLNRAETSLCDPEFRKHSHGDVGAPVTRPGADGLAIFDLRLRLQTHIAKLDEHTSAEYVSFSPDGRWVAPGLEGPVERRSGRLQAAVP